MLWCVAVHLTLSFAPHARVGGWQVKSVRRSLSAANPLRADHRPPDDPGPVLVLEPNRDTQLYLRIRKFRAPQALAFRAASCQ